MMKEVASYKNRTKYLPKLKKSKSLDQPDILAWLSTEIRLTTEIKTTEKCFRY